MKENYQLGNPNNARIKIDYTKKEGDKATFEYVGKRSIFSITQGVFAPMGLYCAISLFGFFAIILTLENFGTISFYESLEYTMAATMIGLILTVIVLFYFTFPALFSMNKKFIKLLPDWQFKNSEHYEALFLPKHVNDCQIEIPLFSNVGLDYVARGEFSKYLTNVEIIEHPFMVVTKRKKRERNEYLWRATFYFSKTPKSGWLGLRFD